MTNATNINDIAIENPKTELSISIAKGCSLDLYKKTLEYKYKDIDISTNDEYKKNFTSYYKVRREKSWLDEYYSYMEKNKYNTNLKFGEVLSHLSSIKRTIKGKKRNPSFEPSFASKMLATINTDNPIWDSRILNYFGIKFSASKNKLDETIKLYDLIKEKIAAFINTEQGKACLDEFDTMFPDYDDISPFKKIDFYLWNLGNN